MDNHKESKETTRIRKELALYSTEGAQLILELLDSGSSTTGALRALRLRGVLPDLGPDPKKIQVQILSKPLQLVWKATAGFYYELQEKDIPYAWSGTNHRQSSVEFQQEKIGSEEENNNLPMTRISHLDQLDLLSCLMNNIPAVLGEEELPWERIPDLRLLQDDLFESVPRLKQWFLVPSTDEEAQNLQAVEDLIKNLSVPEYQDINCVFDLRSNLLDELYQTPPSVTKWKGQLDYTNYFQCCIMPVGGTRELNTSWTHQISTLLYGSRVWVIYAPNWQNLAIIERHKLGFQQGEDSILRSLKDAIIYLQSPGETVVIPPFCPFMVLATRMSLSADYEMRLASNLRQRLQNIEHVSVICDASRDHELGLRQKHAFAEELHQDLLVVLQNKIKDETQIRDEEIEYDSRPIIKQLAMCWISIQESLRDLFIATGKAKWPENVAFAWASAIIGKGKVGKTKNIDCLLCEESFEWHKRTKEDMTRIVGKHVLAAHWKGDIG